MISGLDIFYGHLLKSSQYVPVIRHSNEQLWPSVVLLLCLLLLTLVRMRSFPKVMRLVQSTFSPQILQQLEREERNPFKFYSLALNLIFILNVTFICYKINTIHHLVLADYDRLVQFSFFLGFIVLLFAAKLIANNLLALFTDNAKIFSEYSINSTIVNQTFGLFLFPLIVLAELSDFNPMIFIYAALTVLAGAVILKWYRGVVLGLIEERVGILQLLSYFCGLEILPVFVMVKYLIETF